MSRSEIGSIIPAQKGKETKPYHLLVLSDDTIARGSSSRLSAVPPMPIACEQGDRTSVNRDGGVLD